MANDKHLHRATWHDYRSRCIYMVTMTTRPGVPSLASLQKDGQQVLTRLSPLGQLVIDSIRTELSLHPDVELMTWVMMPDHIHMLIFVTKPIKFLLGTIIGRMKSRASNSWGEGQVFELDFHDRILMGRNQLSALQAYIADNPRRLMVKKEHPELFHEHLHLDIAGQEFAAYGNIMLLHNPFKQALIVHRAYSNDELERHRREWLYNARNRGVIVSPFISRKEREIRDECIAAGASVIQLQTIGFGERFKPSGRAFDLCAAGRLLLLAPWPEETRDVVTRRKALSLNAMAEGIVGLPWDARMRARK